MDMKRIMPLLSVTDDARMAMRHMGILFCPNPEFAYMQTRQACVAEPQVY
jgi:hypothetical protein